MRVKVEVPHKDTIWLTAQTGRQSDFFEDTVAIPVKEWEQLKILVDAAIENKLKE